MAQISPHYRQDDLQKLDTELESYLDEHFLKQLPNLSATNPRVLVVFSGGNAVGKTTLSKKIEAKLHALRLENDGVKRTLIGYDPQLDGNRDALNKLTWQYTMHLYPRLNTFTQNGLLVRDGVIDWYFDKILPFFEESGYRLFIVCFDISEKKAIELIKARGDTPTVKEDRFYKILEDHKIHQARFRKLYQPNVTLNDENIFNHALVLRELKTFLENVD